MIGDIRAQLNAELDAVREAGTFKAERVPANDATPIFMAHGQGDTVLPMSLGTQSRDFLKALGYLVEWHEYPMAHAVCAPEIADIREFLFRVLP